MNIEAVQGRHQLIARVGARDWDFSDELGSNDLFGLHPYPAKFIPQIPGALIENVGIRPGGLVCDPFCGSGTTLIKAQSLGYPSIGIDLNPIACLISRVATSPQPLSLHDAVIRCVRLAESLQNPLIPGIPNLDHWFKEPVQKALAAIATAIRAEERQDARDILRLALSSIVVKVSNQDGDTRYAAVEKNVTGEDVFRLFRQVCEKYMRVLAKADAQLAASTVLCRDILDVRPEDFPEPVGLVICSPPYPNAYEYWLYHKYRMWWLGFDPLYVKDHEIGARPHFFKKDHQTADDFRRQMDKVLSLLHEVCMDDSYVCLVVGDSMIHGETVDNTEIICDVGQKNRFDPIAVLNRDIALSRKAFNLANSRLKSEDVIILQKNRRRPRTWPCTASLRWHRYKYLPYERHFALREIASLPGIGRIHVSPDGISAAMSVDSVKRLSRLVYFSEYSASTGECGRTLQAKLESGNGSNGKGKKQATRYGVHGLHEYKGRFNPQIVRGILNSYNLTEFSKSKDTMALPTAILHVR